MFLAKDVFAPKETPEEHVCNTCILRGEVMKPIFVCSGWFATDLVKRKDEFKTIDLRKPKILQNCMLHLEEAVGNTPGRQA